MEEGSRILQAMSLASAGCYSVLAIGNRLPKIPGTSAVGPPGPWLWESPTLPPGHGYRILGMDGGSSAWEDERGVDRSS